MKRDNVAFMPKPGTAPLFVTLAVAFEHYSEKHPHGVLKYRSPSRWNHQSWCDAVSGSTGANPQPPIICDASPIGTAARVAACLPPRKTACCKVGEARRTSSHQ